MHYGNKYLRLVAALPLVLDTVVGINLNFKFFGSG